MYYKTNGVKLYYEKFENKNKPTMLILPGWGNTRKSFYNLINVFKNYYEIYIIDYPGFGNTKFPNKNLTIYDYAEMIIDMMKDLKINNPLIIAHSFGGRIAILLTGYYKVKIEKMIFLDTAGIKPRKSFKQIFRTYLYKALKKIKFLLPKRYRNLYLKKLMLKFGSKDYNNLPNSMKTTFRNIVNEDLKMYLPAISSEVLIIFGKNDLDTPVSDGKIMNNKIKNSALITIPNCGHFCYIDQFYLICDIIYEYLKEDFI